MQVGERQTDARRLQVWLLLLSLSVSRSHGLLPPESRVEVQDGPRRPRACLWLAASDLVRSVSLPSSAPTRFRFMLRTHADTDNVPVLASMQILRHRDLDRLHRLHPAVHAPAPALVQLERGARTQEGIVPLGIVADHS